MDGRYPSASGIGPRNELPCKSRYARLLRCRSSAGRDPSIWFSTCTQRQWTAIGHGATGKKMKMKKKLSKVRDYTGIVDAQDEGNKTRHDETRRDEERSTATSSIATECAQYLPQPQPQPRPQDDTYQDEDASLDCQCCIAGLRPCFLLSSCRPSCIHDHHSSIESRH